MRRSASCLLLQLALIQQACALLVTPHPCSWHAPRSEVGRSSSPLMLAKRKGKASRGSGAPGDGGAAPEPAGLDVEAAMAQAEVAAAEAAAAKARLAVARARAAVAAKQQPPLEAAAPVAQVAPEPTPFVMVPPDVPFPVSGPADVDDGASFDEKGAIIRDEPKLTLPSFESYSKGRTLSTRACLHSARPRVQRCRMRLANPPAPAPAPAPCSGQAAAKAQRVRRQELRE